MTAFRYPRGVGNVLDVLNVERIEVLRGPQGTLFGRNTIGGAVSVVTKKPGKELGASIEGTTGRFNRVQLSFGRSSAHRGHLHQPVGFLPQP